MSRIIVNDHPYSDEEIEYLEARNRLEEIEANSKQFPRDKKAEAKSTSTGYDPDVFEHVKSLSDEELKSALSDANLETEGTDKELKIRLADYLQAKKNKGE